MNDLPKELPHWASTWERDVFAHLIDHVQNERALLEEYVTAAQATDSKALAYLVNLLIEDERRHHILFSELAAALKSDSELRPRTLPSHGWTSARGTARASTTSPTVSSNESNRICESSKTAREGTPRRQGHHTVGVARRPDAERHRQAHRHPWAPQRHT